jgi:rod shape-determining protein MreB and related proteins
LVQNLDRRVHQETMLRVSIADDPICSVALGAGKMLDSNVLHKVAVR